MRQILIWEQRLIEEAESGFLLVCAATLLLGMILIGCAATGAGNPPQPLPAQVVDEKALEPGLAVLYHEKWYKDVDEMTDDPEAIQRSWRPGKPILYIDHQFNNGEVFGSGLARKVGVRMTGFIRFPESGPWEFRALSNDGIRVFVNGQKVVDDPLLHMGGDRLSSPRTYTVNKAGWHPLLIKYFQKKGTAALSLQWKPPGAEDFSAIPADAYAHLPE